MGLIKHTFTKEESDKIRELQDILNANLPPELHVSEAEVIKRLLCSHLRDFRLKAE